MHIIPAPIWQPVEIVYGVYSLDGEYAGHDRWWIQRLVESETGWMVHNDIFLDAPQKRYITLDVEMGEQWEWLYLNLRDDQGALLAAEVQPGKLVVERNLQVSEFPFDADSELDFLSPFMNSLTLRRLQLQPGQSVIRSGVGFDPDTFEPRLVQQRYERGDDTTFEIDGEAVAVQQIHFSQHESGYQTTLRTREDGLVVFYPEVATLALDERASAGRGRMPSL